MKIFNAIVHQIEKDRNTTASIKLGKGVLTVDGALTTLIAGVSEFFSRGNGVFYGNFDPKDPTAINEITSHRSGKTKFLHLSIELAKMVKERVEKEDWGTGGYVLVAEYEDGDNGNLVFCMLDNVEGVSVDDKNLIVHLTKHLEIKRLRQAVKLSYSDYDNKEEDYLAFVRNSAQDMASQYFMNAFGCTEYSDAKRITTSVIDSLGKFFEDNKTLPKDRQSVKSALYIHIETAYRENRVLKVDEISRVIASAYKTKVTWEDHIRKRKLRIPDIFRPGNNYRQLRTYYTRTTNYKLTFFDTAIIEKEIEYDPVKKTLTIRKIDDDLVKVLGERNGPKKPN